MAFPLSPQAKSYWKACGVALPLSLFLLYVLIELAQSRTLGADTGHTALDFLTLFFTALLYSIAWKNELAFKRWYRVVLFFGVASLAVGGALIGWEAYEHLQHLGSAVPPAKWLFISAGVNIGGNLLMHRMLGGHEHGHGDALHANNRDHILADAGLAGLTIVSGITMWYWGTAVIDHYIAIAVGWMVFPYYAWKRWKEGGHPHKHDHDDHHDH